MTNIPFFMSSVTKVFIFDITSEADRFPRASMRSAVRIIVMTSEPGTPFPDTSATTTPTVRSSTWMKSK